MIKIKRSGKQVIITKFIPATNTKPTRVSARSSYGNNRVVISVDGSKDYNEAEDKAVINLMNKLHWSGKLTKGTINNGNGSVYVFTD